MTYGTVSKASTEALATTYRSGHRYLSLGRSDCQWRIHAAFDPSVALMHRACFVASLAARSFCTAEPRWSRRNAPGESGDDDGLQAVLFIESQPNLNALSERVTPSLCDEPVPQAGRRRVLTGLGAGMAILGPDGSYLAYSKANGGSSLWLLAIGKSDAK